MNKTSLIHGFGKVQHRLYLIFHTDYTELLLAAIKYKAIANNF